jgi:hypothetical protein
MDSKLMPEIPLLCLQDCYHLIGECTLFQQRAHLEGNAQASAMHHKDVEDVHRLINQVSDRVSAHILHFADEHANDKGEVQTGLMQVMRATDVSEKPSQCPDTRKPSDVVAQKALLVASLQML